MSHPTPQNSTLTFDATTAKAVQADPALKRSASAPIAFPIEQVVGKPAAAKVRRIERIRKELLAGSYQQEDVLDTVVDRLWEDLQ